VYIAYNTKGSNIIVHV